MKGKAIEKAQTLLLERPDLQSVWVSDDGQVFSNKVAARLHCSSTKAGYEEMQRNELLPEEGEEAETGEE